MTAAAGSCSGTTPTPNNRVGAAEQYCSSQSLYAVHTTPHRSASGTNDSPGVVGYSTAMSMPSASMSTRRASGSHPPAMVWSVGGPELSIGKGSFSGAAIEAMSASMSMPPMRSMTSVMMSGGRVSCSCT